MSSSFNYFREKMLWEVPSLEGSCIQVIVISHICFLQEAEDIKISWGLKLTKFRGPLQELVGEESLSILPGSVGKKTEIEFPHNRKQKN